MDDLKNLLVQVEQLLAEMDAAVGERPDWKDRDAFEDWRERERAATDKLKEGLIAAGAKFATRPAVDFAIRLGGIRSTSTSGIIGALNNWKSAARKRLEKEG